MGFEELQLGVCCDMPIPVFVLASLTKNNRTFVPTNCTSAVIMHAKPAAVLAKFPPAQEFNQKRMKRMISRQANQLSANT
jgi:hypothetical protein